MIEEKDRKDISSLSEFMNVLMRKIEEVGSGETVWFRGVASEKFKLVPNLYRITPDKFSNEEVPDPNLYFYREIDLIEKNIDFNFSRIAPTFFAKKGIPDTKWNRYTLKQHYDVKTRLL